MAQSKYKKKYARDIREYFLRFIELREDPAETDKAERSGMIHVRIDGDGHGKVEKAPSGGYPTLTKFAISIGVTTRTLRNWRAEFPEFDEACEFCEDIFSDVLDERALTGKCDGRVAMKIRELKANAKRAETGEGGVGKFSIDVVRHIVDNQGLELKEWSGKVEEDESYKPKAD